ncbi:MAG TPA: MraY family glycosyltransferase, partial [bacterium]|nr:MraY family glycosyltransferase [bacterium]
KLAAQTLLSVWLVSSGYTIDEMTSPFGGKIPMGGLGWILSVLWILTIVNAINFIDGLDGLAAGVVFFAAMAHFLIALHPWQNFICLISLALMGATLGFLPYNFSPARIFMGDAGSLYLGALLAGTSLISNTKGATVMSLALPLVVLSIPLVDTVLTVIRRGRRGFNFFTADRGHIHHRLLQLGFTVRQAVLCVYGLSFLLSMSAVLAAQLPNRYTLLFIAVFLAAVVWGLAVFSAVERRVNRSGPAASSGSAASTPLPRP